ncbi:MAG: hypothetical protein ACKVX7_05220 [Planctomycetota bacterium]
MTQPLLLFASLLILTGGALLIAGDEAAPRGAVVPGDDNISQPKRVTLLYTISNQGYVEPCG